MVSKKKTTETTKEESSKEKSKKKTAKKETVEVRTTSEVKSGADTKTEPDSQLEQPEVLEGKKVKPEVKAIETTVEKTRFSAKAENGPKSEALREIEDKKPSKKDSVKVKVTSKPSEIAGEESENAELKAHRVKIKVSEKPAESASERRNEERIEEIERTGKKFEKETKGERTKFNFKVFGKWDMNVVVADMGLQDYINLRPELVPFSAGRTIKKQFWKSKKNIVERLIGKIMVSGHKGKKHYRSSGHNTGKYLTISRLVKETFEIVEKKTGKNPVQVFVDAIVNGAPKEGITTIEYGGVRYPKAVDLSPQRRVDLVLRWLTQGSYMAVASSRGKKDFKTALSEQIIATAQNDAKSGIISKRTELERGAAVSR